MELQALQRSNMTGQCKYGVENQDDPEGLEYDDMNYLDYLDGMVLDEEDYENFRFPAGVNASDFCTEIREVNGVKYFIIRRPDVFPYEDVEKSEMEEMEKINYIEGQYLMLDGKVLTEEEYEKFTFPEGVEKSDFCFEIVEENGVKTYIIRHVEKLPYDVDGIYQKLDGLSLTEDQYIDFCFPDGVYPGDFYVEVIVENGVNLYVIHRKKDNEDELCADTQTSFF